jgi:hypothetical protein
VSECMRTRMEAMDNATAITISCEPTRTLPVVRPNVAHDRRVSYLPLSVVRARLSNSCSEQSGELGCG